MGHLRVETFTSEHARTVLRRATSTDDKYSRGVVGLRTGSPTYPGAAVLGVEGAWRGGAGLVRYVGSAADLVLARRPETVTVEGRSDAWVVGSGQSSDDAAAAGTTALLAGEVPVIADAGALALVSLPQALTVVTPHAGEFARMADHRGLSVSGDSAWDAAALAEELGAVVVLKGSTTLVATPGSAHVWAIAVETPWLSTAGTGDVLAGMMGSVVAQARPTSHDRLAWASAAAVFAHSRAGAIAARRGGATEHAIVALDVADAAPMAIAEMWESEA